MTLQTNPTDRREMVQAIAERLGSPAVYLRTVSYTHLDVYKRQRHGAGDPQGGVPQHARSLFHSRL